VDDPKCPPMATLERMLGLDEHPPTFMSDDERPTSPELLELIDAERPTRPPLGDGVLCAACRGAGRILRVVEAGAGYRARVTRCDRCAGSGCLLPS